MCVLDQPKVIKIYIDAQDRSCNSLILPVIRTIISVKGSQIMQPFNLDSKLQMLAGKCNNYGIHMTTACSYLLSMFCVQDIF